MNRIIIRCWKLFGVIAAAVMFFVSSLNAQNFENDFQNFKKDPALRHSSFAIQIADPKLNKTLFSYNEELSLTPASTLKVLTTSAALQLLGENYRFKTFITYQGNIADSILNGNLVIVGTGDPTLGSEYFEETAPEKILFKIIGALKKRGIKAINGNLVADVSLFDDAPTPANWLWTDMGNYFGSGPTALNFADNKIKVFLKSGKNPGDSTVIVKTVPKVENLKIVNQLTCGPVGSGDNAYFYGAEFQNLRVARGTIPPGKDAFEVSCSMPDAALFMMQELKIALEQSNIKVIGEPTTTRILGLAGFSLKTSYVYLDSIMSPTLSRIVYYTNLKSNNLYAETLLKTLSLVICRQANSVEGIKVVEQFLKNAGISTNGLRLSDGSGLSPVNKITVAIQTQLLNFMYKQKSFKALEASLPVAGRTGSLASMFKGSLAEDNLKAKSGYINGVRSYTGYFTGKSGEQRSFSFIVNNYDVSAAEMKRKMEQLMIKMVESF